MPDPVAPPAAPPAAPPVTPPATVPVSMVGEDGNFIKDWSKLLSDESLHNDETLPLFKNIESLAKSYVHVRKQVPLDKIVKPNEASSEAEWDAYHAAGGKPDTAADYNLTRPDELPEEHYNQELATAAQELFHKIGLSKKQADALFAFNNNNVIALLTKNAQDSELEVTTLKNGLYAKWGNAYEQRKHLGNAAVESGTVGDAEFKERLLGKFGNDPDFIEYSANLGAKFQEAGSPIVTTIPTPGAIQEQINTEIANKAYGKDYIKHGFTKQQHQDQVKKVSMLFQERDKHLKTGFVEASRK